MILRVWRAKVVPSRIEVYRRFEQEQYLPMLHRQPGFLGTLFSRDAEERVAIITLWEDKVAVEATESSPSYRRTSRELAEGGLLVGESVVEILEVEGGELRPEALVEALNQSRRAACSGSGSEYDPNENTQ